MAFNPDSTIYLCNVPIDNTYTHQLYFESISKQNEYFLTRVEKTFANYLTVRKTLPDGSLQSSVKVSANIDDLQNCNYMYYQNANHGTKYFYAFITKFIYVNENTTEIVFETDVYQTWLFETTLKPCYVEREHSATDNVGDNLVPEPFNFTDYHYTELKVDNDPLNNFGYLVALSKSHLRDAETVRGWTYTGIYQGLYFYYFDRIDALNYVLDGMEKSEGECVEFITVIPKFAVSNSTVKGGVYIGSDENGLIEMDGQGRVHYSTKPAEHLYNFNLSYDKIKLFTAKNEIYKNKKLYTNPFYNFVVSNHSGDEAIYNIEDFDDTSNITLQMQGDISANPSITLMPVLYKGIFFNIDSGISLNNFPQCSITSDSYKMWLAKNQHSNALSFGANALQIIGGIASIATGAGAVAGAGLIASGVTGVLSTANGYYQASKEPNKSSAGAPKGNLLTAIGMNKFAFYLRYIREETAETIDNFFTMYGYQTNTVKVPNVNKRKGFNYVKTVDCNITGAIPADDMTRLKNVYNNGVTLWKDHANIFNYNVDNSPE